MPTLPRRRSLGPYIHDETRAVGMSINRATFLTAWVELFGS